jgi:glycerophosphoryl diester phosphodiesterase
MSIYLLGHRGVFTDVDDKENTYNNLTKIKKFAMIHKSKDTSSVITTSNSRIKYGIEFDVQQLKSGELVCYHDETLDRLHGISNKISNMTKYNIINLNIPLLSEILGSFIDSDYLLNIELKSYGLSLILKTRLCDALINILNDYNISYIITSFDKTMVDILLKNNILSFLITHENNNILDCDLDELIKSGMKGIVISKNLLLLNGVDYYISKNIDLMVYTFYNKTEPNNLDGDLIKILNKTSILKNISIITDNLIKCYDKINV